MKDLLSSRSAAVSYADVLNQFADQDFITVAAGATCAYLGDERNLREFLIADEVAALLRRAGHIVTFLLIDDSMDPLNFRQLRVAVDKDPDLIERYKDWCGKPISHLPDPWGCHESYSAHFEAQLLDRLHHLGCYPTLVTTAKLYERGLYAPYVRLVLEQHDEILRFLGERFPDNKPDKLFWLLCPHCRYIHKTRILDVSAGRVIAHCEHCARTIEQAVAEVEGKLNWKLDCAVRWAVLKVDIEPFGNPYLEPQTGTYYLASELARRFFGGRVATAFPYGGVLMEKQWSYKLLDAMPKSMMREMMVTRPTSDIKISREMMVNLASRHKISADHTYLDFIKQLLPMWLLSSHDLTAAQRTMMAHGIAFGQNFLNSEVRLQLPSRAQFKDERADVLRGVLSLIEGVIAIRQESEIRWETFEVAIRSYLTDLGPQKKLVLQRVRFIVGQEHGLPVTRLLFVLPLDYLMMVEFIIALYLESPDAIIAIEAEARRAADENPAPDATFTANDGFNLRAIA